MVYIHIGKYPTTGITYNVAILNSGTEKLSTAKISMMPTGILQVTELFLIITMQPSLQFGVTNFSISSRITILKAHNFVVEETGLSSKIHFIIIYIIILITTPMIFLLDTLCDTSTKQELWANQTPLIFFILWILRM